MLQHGVHACPSDSQYEEWLGFYLPKQLWLIAIAKYEVNSCVSFICGLGFTAFNNSCIIYCVKQTHFCEINGVTQLVQKLPSCVTLECSLSCSQVHTTGTYSLLLESNQRLQTFFKFHIYIILSATSRRCKWSLFPCGFPNRTFYFCHCSRAYYTPGPLHLCNLITAIISLMPDKEQQL